MAVRLKEALNGVLDYISDFRQHAWLNVLDLESLSLHHCRYLCPILPLSTPL
jgi:hypothetical protein